MLRASVLAVLASAGSFAACGGSVVFVEDDDGSGGATTSSTSTSKSASAGKTTGAVTTGAVTTSVTTSGPTSGVTTGPGPQPVCAFGEISDACNGCVEQAQFDDCELQLNACGADDACFSYGDCIFQCNNSPGCCNDCVAENPEGAKLYTDAIHCLVCDACPMECFGAVPGLCQ